MSTFFIKCLSTLLFWIYLSQCDVYQLDETNFDEQTSSGLWYLEFYAPWCGHCKKFAPIYEEASNDLDLTGIRFGAIDATSNKEIAKQFGVSRFPTLKFYENNVEYKYGGARTVEGLKENALKMMEPVIKKLNIKQFKKLNDRFTVSFLYIINDINKGIKHDINYKIFEGTAMRFRPEIPFYAIKYSQFKRNYLNKNDFMSKTLKLNRKEIDNKFSENGDSMIYAITPSIKNKELNGIIFDENDIKHFISLNRYAPIIKLKMGNYKDLVENCKYFGIIFVNGDEKKLRPQANKLIDIAEKLMINNKEWNMESFAMYKEWELDSNKDINDKFDKLDKLDKAPMYKLIISWCNATEFEEWASHSFGIKKEELPIMLIFSPKQDGYWIYNQYDIEMIQFVNNVFNEKLEITYTKNWIARQAMKLERWLNNLNGWQIAAVFVGVFVFLCGIMILLDYCCSPTQQLKND